MLRPAISAFCAAVLLALFSSPARAGSTGTDGPAVFGTAVLAAGTTPYAVPWNRVQSPALDAGASIAAAARGLRGLAQLQFVNAAVNRAIAYRADITNWRSSDYWASAAETFSRGTGDCEDYAIAKMQVLRASGIPVTDLFLVIGNDLAARSGHALLVVRSGDLYWVLDNFHDQVRADTQHSEFRPVVTLSSSGSWLHGSRVVPPASQSAGLAQSGPKPSIPDGRFAAVLAAQGINRSF